MAVLPGRFMATHGGLSREFVEACTGKAGDFSKCLTQEMGKKLLGGIIFSSGWESKGNVGGPHRQGRLPPFQPGFFL